MMWINGKVQIWPLILQKEYAKGKCSIIGKNIDKNGMMDFVINLPIKIISQFIFPC